MTTTQLAGPVIAARESLSAALDCTQGTIVSIQAPAAWTPANITFQLSQDGVTWSNLVDRAGAEVNAAVSPGSIVALVPQMQVSSFIKIRSGTSAAPVVQAVQRTFNVVLKTAP